MTGNKTSSELPTFTNKLDEDAFAPVTVTANTVPPGAGEADSATDRQQRIDGFNQSTFSSSSALMVGAGSLGGQSSRALVRKGIGELIICDEDTVETSNLSRQPFYEDDIGENKAVALAENLKREGTCGTEITALPLFFEDAVARGHEFAGVDIAVVCPDNDEARLAVAEHFLDQCPVVATGLGLDALHGYVFVQEPGEACFKCWRGDNAGGGDPCAPVPSTLDPAMAVSGLILHAIDSCLMDRYRDWTLFEVFMTGVPAPAARTVDRDESCPLCGDVAAAAEEGETA